MFDSIFVGSIPRSLPGDPEPPANAAHTANGTNTAEGGNRGVGAQSAREAYLSGFIDLLMRTSEPRLPTQAGCVVFLPDERARQGRSVETEMQ